MAKHRIFVNEGKSNAKAVPPKVVVSNLTVRDMSHYPTHYLGK